MLTNRTERGCERGRSGVSQCAGPVRWLVLVSSRYVFLALGTFAFVHSRDTSAMLYIHRRAQSNDMESVFALSVRPMRRSFKKAIDSSGTAGSATQGDRGVSHQGVK